MTGEPISVADLAVALAEDGGADDERAHSLVYELLRGWQEADDERATLVADEPRRTGSPRWDAFLGALAEHLCIHADLDCPGWALGPTRFLTESWFDDRGLPALRAIAWVGSPASFRRRGIFVDPADLVRA